MFFSFHSFSIGPSNELLLHQDHLIILSEAESITDVEKIFTKLLQKFDEVTHSMKKKVHLSWTIDFIRRHSLAKCHMLVSSKSLGYQRVWHFSTKSICITSQITSNRLCKMQDYDICIIYILWVVWNFIRITHTVLC